MGDHTNKKMYGRETGIRERFDYDFVSSEERKLLLGGAEWTILGWGADEILAENERIYLNQHPRFDSTLSTELRQILHIPQDAESLFFGGIETSLSSIDSQDEEVFISALNNLMRNLEYLEEMESDPNHPRWLNLKEQILAKFERMISEGQDFKRQYVIRLLSYFYRDRSFIKLPKRKVEDLVVEGMLQWFKPQTDVGQSLLTLQDSIGSLYEITDKKIAEWNSDQE